MEGGGIVSSLSVQDPLPFAEAVNLPWKDSRGLCILPWTLPAFISFTYVYKYVLSPTFFASPLTFYPPEFAFCFCRKIYSRVVLGSAYLVVFRDIYVSSSVRNTGVFCLVFPVNGSVFRCVI